MKDVFIPKTLGELLPSIDNENRRITAGCTDIVVAVKNGKLKQKPLISINKIEEIKRIYEDEGRVFIGSNVPLTCILESSVVQENFKLLVDALETIGSPQIRNRATLGGNLQNASPSGDGILALILLEASVILKSLRGTREVTVEEFILGVGKTDLKNDEFIEYIVINKPIKNMRHYFEKVGLRSAMVIAIASVGMLFDIEDNIIKDMKIGFGAAAPKPLRMRSVENFLKGKEISEELLEAAGEIIAKEISPIDDLRATAEYRKKVCRNLIKRLLEL